MGGKGARGEERGGGVCNGRRKKDWRKDDALRRKLRGWRERKREKEKERKEE